MACETLEQRLYDNGFSQCRAVGTIDAYAMGAYAQYAGPRCEMGGLHDCGIDGWNSTDHGPRPVGAASAEDFDPYGHKEIYPAESRWAVTAAFSEGGILDLTLPKGENATMGDVREIMGRLSPSYPCQTIYDLPITGAQLHVHGPDKDVVTSGLIYGYDRKGANGESNTALSRLNGCDTAFAALEAELLKLRKIDVDK